MSKCRLLQRVVWLDVHVILYSQMPISSEQSPQSFMWLHFLSTKIQNREFPHLNTRLLGRLSGRSPAIQVVIFTKYTPNVCLQGGHGITTQLDYTWGTGKVGNLTAHEAALICSTGTVMNPITEDWGCQTGDSVITKKAWSVLSCLAFTINWKEYSGQKMICLYGLLCCESTSD